MKISVTLFTLSLTLAAGCTGTHQTPTDVALSKKGKDLDGCVHAGCSNQLCVKQSEADGLATTCEWTEAYACYQQADCGLNQETGKCEFRQDDTLTQCLNKGDDTSPVFPDDNGELNQDGCVHGGCSGQLCVEEGSDGVTTCEWRQVYACYQKARCARDTQGKCNFILDDDANECIASSKDLAQHNAPQ